MATQRTRSTSQPASRRSKKVSAADKPGAQAPSLEKPPATSSPTTTPSREPLVGRKGTAPTRPETLPPIAKPASPGSKTVSDTNPSQRKPAPKRARPAAKAPSTAKRATEAAEAPATPPRRPTDSPRASAPSTAPDASTPLTLGKLGERLKALEASIQQVLRLQGEWSAKLEALVQAGSLTAKAPEAAEDSEAGTDAVDAVTASIRRAVSEALDRKLEELMGPAVTLQQRLREEATAFLEEKEAPTLEELQSILDEVAGEAETLLRLMGGCFIHPEKGEFYDPLIHLAVGQSGEGPVEDDDRTSSIVTEVLRPGYRSSRGRVVLPARVFVGRK